MTEKQLKKIEAWADLEAKNKRKPLAEEEIARLQEALDDEAHARLVERERIKVFWENAPSPNIEAFRGTL